MLGLSTVKLIAFAIAAAAILSFVVLSFHWKKEMMARGDQLAAICTATRSASANPKLNCAEVIPQIDAMGQAIATLKTSIADQNTKVEALGAQTVQQQAASQQALKAATGLADKAEATSQALAASSRSGGAPAGSAAACKPSKALEGAWK